MYTLLTRHPLGQWEEMLSGFRTTREALDWLITTYQSDADFWNGVEVKVLRNRK